MESTLELQLQHLAPADWRVLRAARLEALRDSPRAFTSSYARESKWGESEWQHLFDAATWVVACDAEEVIGLACAISDPGLPTMRHIGSIWVAPAYRRRGVVRALLCAVAQIERPLGVTDLLLWVLEDNPEAQSAYEALGFRPTGERQLLETAARFERRFRLDIRELLDS